MQMMVVRQKILHVECTTKYHHCGQHILVYIFSPCTAAEAAVDVPESAATPELGEADVHF